MVYVEFFSKDLKNQDKIYFKKSIWFDFFNTNFEINISNIREILIDFLKKNLLDYPYNKNQEVKYGLRKAFYKAFKEENKKINAHISNPPKIDKKTFKFSSLENNCGLTKIQVKNTKLYLYTLFNNNNELILNIYLNKLIENIKKIKKNFLIFKVFDKKLKIKKVNRFSPKSKKIKINYKNFIKEKILKNLIKKSKWEIFNFFIKSKLKNNPLKKLNLWRNWTKKWSWNKIIKNIKNNKELKKIIKVSIKKIIKKKKTWKEWKNLTKNDWWKWNKEEKKKKMERMRQFTN